jgi:hypothetical protein
LAIVGHQDTGQSTAVGLHLDPQRAGVEGVFDQFLDRAGRPLHHLAGGDAVDGFRRQTTDRHDRAFDSHPI